MRYYVPTTLDRLRTYVEHGRLPDDVDRFEPDGDDEESEYAALMEAADAAASLLDGPGRRVVVVAEVDGAGTALAMSHVVALHCDVAARPVEADPDEDLAWFATQEIDELVAD